MKPLKKILIALGATAIIGGGLYGADLLQQQTIDEQINALPTTLKLKTTTDKILDSETVRDIRCDKTNPSNCQDLGDIKQYFYVSNVEVPAATITIKDGKKNVNIQEDMTKRTENSQHFKIKETATSTVYEAKIYGGAPFYKEGEKYYQTETATTTIEAFDLQTKENGILSFFRKPLLADNFFSGAGDGTSRYSSASGKTWQQVIENATGDYADYTTNALFFGVYHNATTRYDCYRQFFPTDTSAIGAGSTVTAASFFIKVATVYAQSSSNNSLAVAQTDQPSTSEVTTNDYNNCGSALSLTKYSADTVYSGFSKTNYNEIALTDFSVINKTGVTKLGLREMHDYNNTAPSANANDGLIIKMSEQDGTASDPYLSVTYSADEGGGTTIVPNNNIIIFE